MLTASVFRQSTPDSFGVVGPKALLFDRLSKKVNLLSVIEFLSA